MKNITVSVDDETYRRSRIRAAEAGTSVSSVVKAFLTQFAQGTAGESEFERLERLQQETVAAIRARAGGFRAAENVSREELHGRDALR